MERKEFKIAINAPNEKVWDILWNDATYPLWTTPFCEGSRAESDWQKGSKIRFLGGTNEGIVSTIAEKIPNEFMSFSHIGMIKDGVEDYDSPLLKEWAGSLENYTLTPSGSQTELTVQMDIPEDHKAYFLETWPKALQQVKELAERE